MDSHKNKITQSDLISAVVDLGISTSQIGVILGNYMVKNGLKDKEIIKELTNHIDKSLDVSRKLLEKMR